MRFVYVGISVLLFVLNLIVFFQNVTGNRNYQFDFLGGRRVWGFGSLFLFVFVTAFILGVLAVVTVKAFLNYRSSSDDEFDL